MTIGELKQELKSALHNLEGMDEADEDDAIEYVIELKELLDEIIEGQKWQITEVRNEQRTVKENQ